MHVCDTWPAMCVTHGMPCVNMHCTFEAYIYGVSNSVCERGGGGGGGGSKLLSVGEARRRRQKGKDKRRKGKET